MILMADVAKYILKNHGGRMASRNLQKLMFYSQSWHNCQGKGELFTDEPSIWIDGPLVTTFLDVLYAHRVFTSSDIPGRTEVLTDDEKSSIDEVIKAWPELSQYNL